MNRVDAFLQLTEIEAGALMEASLTRIMAHVNDGKPFALMTAYVNEKNEHAIAAGIGPKAKANADALLAVDDTPKTYQNRSDGQEYAGAPSDRAGQRIRMRTDLNAHNRNAQENLLTEIAALELGYIRVVGVYKHKDGTLVREPSLFVIGIDPDTAVALGKKFWQESVLVGQKDTGVLIRYCDGRPDFQISSHVTPHDFEEGWSVWHRKNFSFQDYQPVKLESVAVITESRTDNFEYVSAVHAALHRRYGAAKVEAAIARIMAGVDPEVAVAEMKVIR